MNRKSRIYNLLVKLSSLFTFSILIFIILHILIRGIPSLNLKLFSLKYSSENLSLFPAIITTILLILLTMAIATPIGVFTGFYLVEYSDEENIFVKMVKLATETLSAIPSIVFGLFGMIFFVIKLDFKYSLLAGSLTMVLMVIPLIIRSTEEALLSVSKDIRMASYALGAGEVRTIFKVVLPEAMPGILSGIILGIGRIFGETAALMFTLGTATTIPKNIFSSGRTLALHMYVLANEGIHVEGAYATGVILLIVILLINYMSQRLSQLLIGKEERK